MPMVNDTPCMIKRVKYLTMANDLRDVCWLSVLANCRSTGELCCQSSRVGPRQMEGDG